ncbi:MAG: molybdenum cofactor guanylyltransferase [Armatimonadetes bacterium]|nr:molybdenum cofactor guanylyltransferase [Armatimonadota bacterium]
MSSDAFPSVAPLSCVILAGGEGRRMGMPKLYLRLGDRPILEIVIERLRPVCSEFIVVLSPALGRSLDTGEAPPPPHGAADLARILSGEGVRTAFDVEEDKGPLYGLMTGLSSAEHSWTLAVSCDAPLVSPRLVRSMWRYTDNSDVIVPERAGRLQPLQALYRTEAVQPEARRRVRGNRLKMRDLLKESPLRVHTVPEAEWSAWGIRDTAFTNLNTPEDLETVSLLLNDPNHDDLLGNA